MEKIGVFCSSSDRMEQHFYEEGRRLGQWLGQTGRTLVYGGIACGMMEVVAQAAHEAGGRVFGVVPTGLNLKAGQSEAIDVAFYCDDLTDRKTWLMQESDVLVVMPGSVGTLDEAFTAMAASMVGMRCGRIIFWNIDGFYDTLFRFLDELNGRGVVNKAWSEIYESVNTFEELCEKL